MNLESEIDKSILGFNVIPTIINIGTKFFIFALLLSLAIHFMNPSNISLEIIIKCAYLLGALAIILDASSVGNIEVDTDEWYKLNNNEEDEFLCSRCLTPYSNRQHYCNCCGFTVGKFTSLIPLVNIRHNNDMYATIWKELWFKKNKKMTKTIFYFLFLVTAPMIGPFILLGILFVIYEKQIKKT